MRGRNTLGCWKRSLLGSSLVLAFALPAVAAPERYVRSRVVADLGADTTRRISDAVLFNESGDVVYQIDSNTAVRRTLGYFFSAADGTSGEIRPPVDYGVVVTAPGLNDSGMVAGQARTLGGEMQTAFVWTLAGGPERAVGLDVGSSDFKAINGNGLALGSSEFSSFELVTWIHPEGEEPVVTVINPPDGATRVETIAVDDLGECLLIVDRDVDGVSERQLAIWDGLVSRLIGPVLPDGFNLFNANAKLNNVGDVAAVVFNPDTQLYAVWLIRADERESTEIFDFPRLAENVFQVQFNDLRQVCFGTDGDRVEFLDTTTGASRSFDGFRGLLNSKGQLVFGNQRDLFQWDSLQPSVAPVVVPVEDGGLKLAPDVVAFNGRGELVLRLARTVEPNGDSLEVFVGESDPIPPPAPVVVAVEPVRRAFRIDRGDRFSRRVVDLAVVSGGAKIDGRIRYSLKGRLPRGLRFRANRAKIAGRARVKGKFVVRVFAEYRVGGEPRRSSPARVKIRVRRD